MVYSLLMYRRWRRRLNEPIGSIAAVRMCWRRTTFMTSMKEQNEVLYYKVRFLIYLLTFLVLSSLLVTTLLVRFVPVC